MKIGLLGGTFDPPHNGHLQIAKTAIEQLGLDEVLFIPASRNPLKRGTKQSPAKHRLAMVEKMISDEPNMGVCDLEISLGGNSYTVDTLTELTYAQPGEYWFLLGSDSLKTLQQWKQPQRLLKLCRLGVVVRAPARKSEILRGIDEDTLSRIDLIDMPPIEISSTGVRDLMFRGRNLRPYLKPTVLQYIEEHKLYRS